MDPPEEFPIGRANDAPSDGIGWHFGTVVQGRKRNSIQCKYCGRIITGGITRLKEHLAHMPGEVKRCASVGTFVRENMMKLLLDSKAKKNNQRKRKEEFVSRLRGSDDDEDEGFIDEDASMRHATQESIMSHRQWEDRQRFQRSGIGSSSGGGASSEYQERNIQQRMRQVDVDLERSKSMKQTKIGVGMLKNARKKLGKALSKLIIHERLPIDASDVASRNIDYYFKLLDNMVEEVGEEYVVQIVTDNEAALKAAGLKLMEKRTHLYWSPCAAHCLDLCLEDIGKKTNVKKLLEDAKTVTLFINNHIWTVNLMKKYTGGKEIIRPAITRFATQFLQLESIVKERQALKNMFDSDKYKNSKFGKDKSGAAYQAKTIVMSKEFWTKATEIIKVFEPIVKVLKLVDGDEKPTMGFLYEATYYLLYSAEWWIIHGSCAPELQNIAVKVLSQTTSASNCERNWSTFSYIHTKTRNRLKYQRLQKLLFAYYNMKLKMRTTMRRSQEDIERGFNPINLDHIFQEDYLSPWIEEREGPLLDGPQNAQWLSVDSDDEIEELAGGDASDSGQVPSEGGDGGLSPPSQGNSGSSGGNDCDGNLDQSCPTGEGPFFSYNEEPYVRRDENLMTPRMEEDSRENMTGGGRRGQSRRGKSRRHEATPMEDSSSSSVSQSFGDFGIAAQTDGSQGNYPSYYHHSSYMPHEYYPYMPNPNLPQYQPPMNYSDSSATYSYGYQQIEPPRSSGLFDYVFGGSGYNNNEGDSESYDLARRSTMW